MENEIKLKKEIKPLYSFVLVELFDGNPYEEMVTESGLKLTSGAFDNPDTGIRDRKDFGSFVARIIDVGPDCKYAKPGDHCIILPSLKPIIFRGNTYFTVAEQNILALMGDDLDERFK